MNKTVELLKVALQNSLDNINAGNTNLTEEQAMDLVEHLEQINKGSATVSKAYACEHLLHININKFDYLVRTGIIPVGRKRLGFKELSWKIKDFDRVIEYLKHEH